MVLVETPVLEGSVVLEGTTLGVDESVSLVLVNVAERQSVDAETSAITNAEPLTR